MRGNGKQKTVLTAAGELQSYGTQLEQHEHDPEYDRRLLRGERTRHHIAQAMIELIEEGNPRPTARLIAERAGVSIRLVFHHFDDVEEVFQEGAIVQAQRHWKKVVPIDPAGAVADRVEAVCRQRRQLYQAITPVRRAAVTRSAGSTALVELLQLSRTVLRDQLTSTFAPELDRGGIDPGLLLDALESATSWEVWERLRSEKRTAIAAQRVMEFTVTSLLGCP
jgi:AcrR family transcriptional regulator